MNFCMYTTLGQGQEMTLTFNTHIYSIRCLLLLTFRSLAAIVSELELMFMKHYAPNRCLYIKVAKLRTGAGNAEMSHLQNAVSKYI